MLIYYALLPLCFENSSIENCDVMEELELKFPVRICKNVLKGNRGILK